MRAGFKEVGAHAMASYDIDGSRRGLEAATTVAALGTKAFAAESAKLLSGIGFGGHVLCMNRYYDGTPLFC